jgi:hypothetical protein
MGILGGEATGSEGSFLKGLSVDENHRARMGGGKKMIAESNILTEPDSPSVRQITE